MNKEVEGEGRPRPLSTGLWTLFSWLRRDERSSSSESLSSAGSDRTAASFAFLAPAHYHTASEPLALPPPGPPTDSYRKRVHDRNLRRQYDRDLTLHRKYGLFKSEAGGSYDAFSLPPVRRASVDCNSKWERERRAASECLQRRGVHVPGKRRAPAPPVIGSAASLPRRHTRKRPAPQPPGKLLALNKEYLASRLPQMNVDTASDKQKSGRNDVLMGCKSEKYSKKDVKDSKIRSEKSFLKHIFDNKKRNSAIDTSSVKLLPSISELDKQAAEIIETCKIKPSAHDNNDNKVLLAEMKSQSPSQGGTWFCVSCLRKYNALSVTCSYCEQNRRTKPFNTTKDDKDSSSKLFNSYTQAGKDLTNLASSSKQCAAEEKQKLKEMLKEMKDSLPKRPKPDSSDVKNTDSIQKLPYTVTETPTLRVESKMQQQTCKVQVSSQPSPTDIPTFTPRKPFVSIHKPHLNITESPLVTQQVIIDHNVNGKYDHSEVANKKTTSKSSCLKFDDQVKSKELEAVVKKELKESSKTAVDNIALNTPLKVSSLLNPVYIPKERVTSTSSANVKEEATKVPLPITQPVNKLKRNEILTSKSDSNNSSQLAVPTSSNMQTTNDSSSRQSNAGPVERLVTRTNMPLTNNTPQIKMLTVDKNVLPDPKNIVNAHNNGKVVPYSSKEYKFNKVETQDQHSKRRDLINQLEQSIAKGDERAAAEAAAKLAQLRLSCSVLSFTSQILSQTSTSSDNANPVKSINKPISTLPQCNEADNIPKIENKPQNVPTALEKSVQPQSGAGVKSEVNKSSPASKITNNSLTENEHVVANQDMISIAVMVEDREATRGPVHLRINRSFNLRDLRREAETSLGLATNLQRWIIGRTLCTEDGTLVTSLAGPDFSAPFYLCIVESETGLNTVPRTQEIGATKLNGNNKPDISGNVYTELVQLEQQALVPNPENFECGVCMEEYEPGKGVVLRDCVHTFCKECLSDVVRHCEEANVPCPAMGCRGMLEEREIRAIVTPLDYERWLARGLAAAESGTRNAFHCRTRDCTGWALCDPGVQRFPCPVCKRINCLPCQAIHEGLTCEQHQTKLKEAAGMSTHANQADEGTRTLLNALISKGEALECPECKAIITKKWGCDWVKCSACKTEICWVTRGRRWGPAGRGDTSGGCRCGVEGKRCHPSCGYCH